MSEDWKKKYDELSDRYQALEYHAHKLENIVQGRGVRAALWLKEMTKRHLRFLLPLIKIGKKKTTTELASEVQGTGSHFRLAVHLHLFYVDLWDEILEKLKNINQAFDMYIHLVEGFYADSDKLKIEADLAKLTHVKKTEFLFGPNKGRDIASFLYFVNKINLDHYDVILKLQSKKSGHKKHGDGWRKLHFISLLGSKEQFQKNMAQFSTLEIGMMGARECINKSDLGANYPTYKTWCEKLGFDSKKVEFVEGSMFYVRATLLKPFQRPEINFDLFENEQGKQDGAIEHAFERLLGSSICNKKQKIKSVHMQ